jgi:hypothetical protein
MRDKDKSKKMDVKFEMGPVEYIGKIKESELIGRVGAFLKEVEYPKIEVIPADPPTDDKINWTCREYMGTEIYHYPDPLPETRDEWREYVENPSNIWRLFDDPPQTGDEALVNYSLGGGLTPIKFTSPRQAESLNGNWVYFIQPSSDQDNDDRDAWLCCGAGNLAAIKKLEIYTEDTELDRSKAKLIKLSDK